MNAYEESPLGLCTGLRYPRIESMEIPSRIGSGFLQISMISHGMKKHYHRLGGGVFTVNVWDGERCRMSWSQPGISSMPTCFP